VRTARELCEHILFTGADSTAAPTA
jgi:hypothetical protein